MNKLFGPMALILSCGFLLLASKQISAAAHLDIPASFKAEKTSQEILAFKADNGHFWSVVNYDDRNNIEAVKSSLDQFSQFLVFPASNGKIYIKTPHDKYLSRIHRSGIDYIEPAKDTADVFCEFQLFIQEGKMVLKADNGKYLSRVNRLSKDNIEAAKEQIDEFCLFEVVEFKVVPFGILELFINNKAPIAFKTDLGHFWSVSDGNIKTIEAPHLTMTPSAKFFVEKGPSGRILLKTPQNKYLSRIHRNGIDYIEAAKDEPDVFCEFIVIQSYTMALQADNGKYLSRIRWGSRDTIEAAKQNIDVFCYFDVVPYSE
ncbi:uncharacterized protein LOC122789939 [Protopterus annectens]|uniref:uncharacterized protein LOC122789939 n=1 Tax=Protopterus annectens TaxID=7888 RepID=UPI001CF9505C|nr:uncharacterized protein LOC122789939 [Protopterus annectens]